MRRLCAIERTGLTLCLLAWAAVGSGCPASPCVGPGCEEVYDGARLDIFLGSEVVWPTTLDPIDNADLAMVGLAAQGDGWSAAMAAGVLFVGSPDIAQVTRYNVLDLTTDLQDLPAVATFMDDDPETGFGTSLLLLENQDGSVDLLVGAPFAPGLNGEPSAGQVLLFADALAGTDALTAGQATKVYLGQNAYDKTGSALASCGMLDGDGKADWATSSPWSEQGAPLGGSVTVALSSLIPDDSLKELPLAEQGPSVHGIFTGGQAGASFICDMDFTDDGLPDLVVGCPYEDDEQNGLEGAGAVYIAEIPLVAGDNALPDLAHYTLWGPSAEIYLGASLSAAHLPGQTRPFLVVGAPGSMDGRGKAFLFSDFSAKERITADFGIKGAAEGDRFGALVHLTDLTGDSLPELLVGAPRHNPTGEEADFASGAVYLWRGQEDLLAWQKQNGALDADTTITRAQAWLLTGSQMTSGDLDGDGIADLLLTHHIQPEE